MSAISKEYLQYILQELCRSISKFFPSKFSLLDPVAHFQARSVRHNVIFRITPEAS